MQIQCKSLKEVIIDIILLCIKRRFPKNNMQKNKQDLVHATLAASPANKLASQLASYIHE